MTVASATVGEDKKQLGWGVVETVSLFVFCSPAEKRF
jgi:hypothetical protein